MQQPEHDFNSLQRVLKLKRYEQPPPGYFPGFSREVISRIRRDGLHKRTSALEAVTWEAPWLDRMLGWLQAKPMYSGLAGVAACLLVIAGVIYAERPPVTDTESGSVLGSQEIAEFGLRSETPAVAANVNAGVVGALPPGTTLFDRNRSLQTAPVFGVTNLLQPAPQ